MDLKNFNKWQKYCKEELPEGHVRVPSKVSESRSKKSKALMSDALSRCKLFEIDDSLQRILFLTNNPGKEENMPFGKIPLFFDVEFNLGNNLIAGFIVINEVGNNSVIMPLVFPFSKNDEGNHYAYIDYFSLFKDKEVYASEDKTSLEEGEREKMRIFLFNFLSFLNHPDVEYRVREWPLNKAREKRGKLKIPDLAKISITGKLYKYIYEDLPKQEKEAAGHSFWVRGHYMHFWDRTRWRRLYKLPTKEINRKGYQRSRGVISKWILPYIKGKGILLNKTYKVK